ncbi:MAG: hypothetical protein JOZ07_06175 [Solirubrobacterales bacterium]|nr:hypothetical protein [Solirubrobacterales bacterium]
MCVLCGEPLSDVHWADREADPAPIGVALAGEDRDGDRRRAWLRRLAVLRPVLGAYGLTVRDWNGRRLVLADGKGASALARDLAEVWSSAARLSVRMPDPLDPELLRRLKP